MMKQNNIVGELNDLISIVVPVYNVEAYLKICVDSIINQTYKNIEIILIDDGSTDLSGKICDEYKIKDERIIVVHKANGGLSDARNAGIVLASGKYITFIDSDDYVNKDFILYLYRNISNNKADIAICDYVYVDEDSKEFFKCDYYEGDLKTNLETLKEMYIPRIHGMEFISCCKLYNIRLFDNIKFPVGKINEDMFTTYKLIYCSNKIVFCSSQLYYYRWRQGSITKSKFSINKLHAVEAAKEACDYFDKYMQPDILALAINQYFRSILKAYYLVKKEYDGSDKRSHMSRLFKEYRQAFRKYFMKSNFSFCKKTFYGIMFVYPNSLLIKLFIK